ncbi:hypothetical protein [Streptomyces virginiae]|uniref:hypothetical protein n=1 Tax=Streptomyces virginiae TaxID=1961 RepID=UPI00345238E8
MERAPHTTRGGAVVVLTLLVALVAAGEAARLGHEAQAKAAATPDGCCTRPPQPAHRHSARARPGR